MHVVSVVLVSRATSSSSSLVPFTSHCTFANEHCLTRCIVYCLQGLSSDAGIVVYEVIADSVTVCSATPLVARYAIRELHRGNRHFSSLHCIYYNEFCQCSLQSTSVAAAVVDVVVLALAIAYSELVCHEQ